MFVCMRERVCVFGSVCECECVSAGTYNWCITQQFWLGLYTVQRDPSFGFSSFARYQNQLPSSFASTFSHSTGYYLCRKTCSVSPYRGKIPYRRSWNKRCGDCCSQNMTLSICEVFEILSKLNWSHNSTRRIHNDPRISALQKNASHLAFHSVWSLKCAAVQRDSCKQQCN